MASTSGATGLNSTSVTGLGLTGLSSGLDTSGIITKLMTIEAAPQTQLKSQLTNLQAHTAALQSLNAAIAGVATTAKAAVGAGVLNSFTATSSSAAATATAGSTAATGTVSFTVDHLASAQVTITDAMKSWDVTAAPSITIRTNANGASPKDTPIPITSSNLDDVVAAINGKKLGVTATKVAAGVDGSGATIFRLQLRSGTGAANAFAVSTGSTYSSSAQLGTSVVDAADAQLTVYGKPVLSATNTFKNVMTGVDVTASATSTTPVSVDVVSDATAASTSAQALTAGLAAVFSGIAASSAVTTSASTSGGASSSATSGGIFTGDSLVRTVNDALLTAATGQLKNGKSPSSIGISLTKNGTVTFDQAAFTAAMTSDPLGTTAMYQEIAGRVSDAASGASAATTGSISLSIKAETTRQSDVTSKISDWDTRLAAIQAQYEAQFNAMETALNALSSQSNYLTSQITGLTTNYQSK